MRILGMELWYYLMIWRKDTSVCFLVFLLERDCI